MKNFSIYFDIPKNNLERYTPEKVSQEFEGLFIYFLLKEMRKTVPAEEGLFPKTRAEEFFDEMFDEYLSSEIARAGGLGLTSIYKKYIKE